MGKRSDFERRPHDAYETPASAVTPLLPHLRGIRYFAEPCAGRGLLIQHLEAAGLRCLYASELQTGLTPLVNGIAEGIDALTTSARNYSSAQAIISNPPWTREILHPLIRHLSAILPTWLLFDADWVHTKQASPLVRHCSHIISVGRVKWIAGSANSGKDNAAWHRFDRRHFSGPQFFGHDVKEPA